MRILVGWDDPIEAETISLVLNVDENYAEVYTEAEELAQTRAGRVRLHARETLQAVADRLLLRADDDVKVQGERVHLG